MKLPRSMMLRRWSDFQRVRSEGRSYSGKHLILGVLPVSEEEAIKVGFITSKKVGIAVQRNLVRRRLRSILSEVGEQLSSGHHIVTIARHSAARCNYQSLSEEWASQARRAKLLS